MKQPKKLFCKTLMIIATMTALAACASAQQTDGGRTSGATPAASGNLLSFGELDSLLRGARSEIHKWGDGDDRRDVTVYFLDPKIKDELYKAVLDAGFYQVWSNENPRDWELQNGVLRWCVSPNTEKWDNEIQISAVGERTVHHYGFKPLPPFFFAGSGERGTADGSGAQAQFHGPDSMVFDSAGNLYVAEEWENRIRKITPAGVVSTFIGGNTRGYADGTVATALFNELQGMAFDSAGNLYVADKGNNRIRKITPAGVVTTLAGSTQGYADGTGAQAKFHWAHSLAFDNADNLYVGERGHVRKITPSGVVTTLLGNLSVRSVGVAVDSAGNVYAADRDNNRILKITPTGVVTTLAGGERGFADGTGAQARFNDPSGLAVDRAGNIYVADRQNHSIRKITPEGMVTTLTKSGEWGYVGGTDAAAQFTDPRSVAIDSADNVYVAETDGHRIRKITIPAP